jgi:hypothetical protein
MLTGRVSIPGGYTNRVVSNSVKQKINEMKNEATNEGLTKGMKILK